jgi:hypothetical protein
MVYRYRKHDINSDDYVYSTRMATRQKIEQIRADVLEDTEAEIDSSLAPDGWTEKNFFN